MLIRCGIRAKRKAERPREILEAAFEEFVLNGYAGTRLEDVAKRARVTKGTIYFYFENKEKLFEAVIKELAEKPLSEFMACDAEWTSDLATDLRDFLKRLYGFSVANPRSREILRLLIAEANRFPALVDAHFDAFMRPIMDCLRERLVEATERGEMRPLALKHLSEVILGPALAINILMLLFANRRPLDPEAYLETHIAILFGGLFGDGAGPATG